MVLIGIAFLTVVALLCYSFVAVVGAFASGLENARRGIVLVWLLGSAGSAVTNWGVPL